MLAQVDSPERSVVDTPAKPQSWQVPVALASILMGILISLQFRNQTTVKQGPNKLAEAIAMIKNLEEERDKITQELQATRARIAEIEQQVAKNGSDVKMLAQQNQEARMQAGLLTMKGPGVTITLTDSKRRPGPDEDAYFFIIHDTDLQALVNELFAAGAEAVSVNDQRIITRSSIRCVGPAVLVNTVQLASPFVVRAIGNAKEIEGGLRMPNGWVDSMNMLIRSGGEIRIASNEEVITPGFTGVMAFRFGQPVPENSKTGAVSANQP